MRLTSHELGVADLSQCTGCYYTYLNGITFSAKVVHVTQRHGIILVNRTADDNAHADLTGGVPGL